MLQIPFLFYHIFLPLSILSFNDEYDIILKNKKGNKYEIYLQNEKCMLYADQF